MNKYFFVLLLVIICISHSHAQHLNKLKTIKVSGDYVHASTGTIFPEQIDNSYKRTGITAFDKKRTDVCAGYEMEAPTGKTEITVYIYPAGEATDRRFRDEYSNCLAAIAMSYQHDIESTQIYCPYSKNGYKVNGFMAFVNVGKNENSILQLYECGGWFLKLRLTSSYLDSLSIINLADKFISQLDPVNLVKHSPVRPNTKIIIAKRAFRDTISFKAAVVNASVKAEWIDKHLDSLERISGIADLYLDMYIESLTEANNIMQKLQNSSGTDESKRYQKQLNLLINNGYVDEFLMQQFAGIMITPKGKAFDWLQYYKWCSANTIDIDVTERMFILEED